MELNVETPQAMSISRQIPTDRKRLKNMEYFKYLGSITNYAIYTQKNQIQDCHGKNRIPQDDSFHQQKGFKTKEKIRVLLLKLMFVWC